jgi:imidazolonepropionase
MILTLGVSQLNMCHAETFIAATVIGAAGLVLAERVGQIWEGFSDELALFEMEDVRELPYWYGERRCMSTWLRGKTCDEFGLAIS